MGAPVVSILEAADYPEQIAHGAQMLRDGNVVVMPTETVYGAAGIVNNPAAMAKLKAFRRSDESPLTIHLGKADEAMKYIGQTSQLGHRMMRKLWPGPVGLTFDVEQPTRKQVSAELNVAEHDLYRNGAITLRCPDHTVAKDLLEAADAPVVATTVTTNHWAALADQVDLILDAGPTRYSKPSTLVKISGESYQIARIGVYDERIIEKLLKTTILFVCSGNTCRSARSGWCSISCGHRRSPCSCW